MILSKQWKGVEVASCLRQAFLGTVRPLALAVAGGPDNRPSVAAHVSYSRVAYHLDEACSPAVD